MTTTISNNDRSIKVTIKPKSNEVLLNCNIENGHILPFADFLSTKNIPAEDVIRDANANKGTIKVLYTNQVTDPEAVIEQISTAFIEFFDLDPDMIITGQQMVDQGHLRNIFGHILY